MATIKFCLSRRPSKEGKLRILLSISHRQDTCYISTRFQVDDRSQFRNQQVVKRPDSVLINSKLRSIIFDAQERMDSVDTGLYSCAQLKEIIAGSTEEKPTYSFAYKSFIRYLEDEGRHSYALLIERSGRYFTELTGDLFLSDITPSTIQAFSRFLTRTKKLGQTTTGMMLGQVKAVINRQISQSLVRYDTHPFTNVHITKPPVRELDLSLESFNAIRNAVTMSRKESVARDCFLLSFYLGGINLIDLMSVRFTDDEKIEYIRTKTKNNTTDTRVITIPVIPQARSIIERWLNKRTMRLDFGYSFSYHNFSRYISRTLSSLGERLGISKRVVYYSARKSFAQYASDTGVPDGIIDYCLGHSDSGKGVIRYYTKVRLRQAKAALIRVADYVENPDKYSDLIEMRL